MTNWSASENVVLNMFKWCFSALDSIDYYGITLLDFWLAVLIIGVIIKLLIARASNNVRTGRGGRVKATKSGKSEEEGE